MDNRNEKQFKMLDKRLGCWQVGFAIFAVALIIHLFCLQVLDLKHYRVKAKRQRMANTFVMRGDIYDRNGIKLATDKVLFDIFLRKADMEDHTPEELAQMLSPILHLPYSTLLKMINKDAPFVLLKKGADRETRDKIADLHLREIPMDKKNIRIYPQGSLLSHVLGYYNFDAEIAAGVEQSAKEKLERVDKKSIEKTPNGDIIYNFATDPLLTTAPLKGENVTLTIDTAVQHVCEQELYKAIAKFKALRGVVIVMNPKNGEILGYAAYPYYDPNNFKKANYTQLKNWAITDIFPPGSTFKILTVASAMELGKITKYTRINDTGKIKVGWWDIENYDYRKRPNPGMISLEYLFEHSSNVGSVRVAQTMTSTEFYNQLRRFGFGSKTGIDLPGESVGLIKKPHKWDVSDHASMGYGYGASVTAIQMASAISAIANDGVRVTPHVIKYSDEEAEQKIKRTQVMTKEHANAVTDVLVNSINNGKSQIKMDKYNVAAKTGTSRKPKENGSGYTNKLYTSAIGYLPASDPEILIYVMIDSAQGYEIWGSTVAVPVFKEIATQLVHILNLTPDKI